VDVGGLALIRTLAAPLRGATAPVAVALAALAVGITDMLCAVSPAAPRAVRLLAALPFPGGAPVARSVTFAAGAMLVWLASGLARRKRRAWLLALATVGIASAAHLGRGLDIDQAVISVALLGALVGLRRSFDVPGDPTAMWPLVRALVVVVIAWAAVGSTASAHLNRITDLGFELLLVAAAVRAAHLWLRSQREPSARTPADADRARAIVARYGDDSLSFFALRADRRYAFSAEGNAFLAYRVIAGCALVSGDPIGAPAEIPGLVHEFAEMASLRGWRLVALHVSDRWLHLYRARGMRAVPVGDEAVLRPATFSLEGRKMRKVRQSVARLEREGFTARVAAPSELAAADRAEILRVNREWLGRAGDRGFSMAMDDLFAHPEARFVLGAGPDGRLGGFLHLVPCLRGYSLGAMRRSPATPNGLMEWLICVCAERLGEAGAEELSLNFAVFAAALRAGPGSPAWLRAARVVVVRLDRLFQLDRLYSFNRKFLPEWRTRYVCFERLVDVPVLSMATLHAESLIPVPARPRPTLRSDA
jgi:lysyl-tRNA synthetase, class II